MVLPRIHWSLMATTTTPTTSIFVAKTQCTVLRGYTAACFPGVSISWRNVYAKGSQSHLRFRKARSASTFSLAEESKKRSYVHSLSVFGSTMPPTRLSIPGLRFSSKNVKPTYEAFSKRMLSAVATTRGFTAARTSESMLVADGKASQNLSSIFSSNHKRHVKPLSVQNTFPGQSSKKGTPDHRVLAQKNVSTVNSSEVLAGDGEKEINLIKSVKTKKRKTNSPNSVSSSTVDNKPEPKSVSKPKQGSRSKKKKEEISDPVPPSDITLAKDTKKLNNPNGKSPQPKESSSSAKTTMEVVDPSHSTEVVTKKKAGGSRKKGKSLREIDVEEKPNGALPKAEKGVKAVKGLKQATPSTKSSPQANLQIEEKTNGALPKAEDNLKQATPGIKSSPKPNPQTVNGIKSIQLKPLYPPTGRSVVVVESATKAKVIQGYLGGMYEVIASYGHVRDLAARSGSVRPDDDFSMVWEVPSPAWTHLKSIKVAISGADNLILASDPDREGEAIAWHIIEMLQQQDALRKELTVARVVFQEITETAIKSALQTPRDIDVNLVQAYLARRALDYLIGFNISPLLWRKLPGCQSAGRVQSAALSLLCDRELEIEEFKSQEYWTLEALFKTSSLANSFSLKSHLTHFNSKKLNQLSVGSETEAKDIEKLVILSVFKVNNVKKTKVNRNPPTPYITSTLQQDAANKLNFSAAHTMKLAQKLYEGVRLSDGSAAGLITYMRTDGLNISDVAARDICSFVTQRYGTGFAASTPRKFFKKVKNAQEAHEAIRPTDLQWLPSTLASVLDEDSLKLYTLIWARTMACQMEPAKVDQIQLDIGNDGGSISFRATCSVVAFPGYRAVYEDVETRAIRDNENESSDREEVYKILGNLKQGDPLNLGNLELKEHHTQPPPRYSEASLVKKLEELGIGRPSTYASTLKVLQDRKYVTAKSRVLFPEFRGRMVSAFLSHYFTEVTDYSFTADMETELDNVSAGSTEWKGLLKDYWSRFSTYCDRAGKVHIHQVEKMLERTYESFLFHSLPDETRTCPACLEGTLTFKVSRFGAGYFIGCDQHPKCKFIAKTLYGEEEDDDAPQSNGTVEEPKLLGPHPVSGEKVLLKNGPYGWYVQLGEDKKGYLPKRAAIPQNIVAKSISFEQAMELLRFPVLVGSHPVDGQPIVIKIGKGTFTVRHRRNIAPVPKNLNPNNIDMEKALELLASKDVRKSGRPKGKQKREEEAIDDF